MFGLTITSSKHLSYLEVELERLRIQLRRAEDDKARLVDRILEVNGVRPVSFAATQELTVGRTDWKKQMEGFTELLNMDTSSTPPHTTKGENVQETE